MLVVLPLLHLCLLVINYNRYLELEILVTPRGLSHLRGPDVTKHVWGGVSLK